MDWQETQRRLLERLSAELRQRWGSIREIEGRLGISDGYLAKLCQGKNDFKLGLFLKSIDALGLDPRAFFSRALEIEPRPEDYLRQIDDPRESDAAFARMARATGELEVAELPAIRASAIAGPGDVAELAACPRQEQLRRLKGTARYRTHAFARAYLEHLDALRYDRGEEAARLATRVAVRLIPALPGPRRDRLALQCLALGVFGSARRLKGRFSAASRAFLLALDLARRAGLQEETGNLLIRASYLLKDFGHFQRALALVNEALVIFVRLGSRWGIGRALVDQGMMQCYLGDYRDAVLGLEQALKHLSGSERELSRYHLAAYQYAAYAHEQLGELDRAQEYLVKGAAAFAPSNAVDAAKLQWLHGRLAFRRTDYAQAERLLRRVSAVLASKEAPGKEALVTLDLIRVFLVQGRIEEATKLARTMAPLLFRFKNNRIAEAAIVELINAAAEGRLHESVVCQVRAKLESGRTPRRGAPLFL